MSQQNKAVSRRVVEELFVGGKLDLADELMSADFVGHDVASPEPIRGPEGLKAQAKGYRDAFPDLSLEIEDQIAEGDRVVTRWTATGTHKGDLFGIADRKAGDGRGHHDRPLLRRQDRRELGCVGRARAHAAARRDPCDGAGLARRRMQKEGPPRQAALLLCAVLTPDTA